MDPSPRSPWFAFPRVLWVSLLAAVVLVLPSLGLGFMNDDYFHLLVLEGGHVMGSRFDLYRFAEGDPETLQRMVDAGPYPWWTLPELRLVLWRPLSSALTALDHSLFGRAALGWHLHSLAWYLALISLVGVLLRRLLPGAIGALALFLFAIDGAHFLPVAWPANRNALVASVPALFGLWMYLEWREHQRPWSLPLAMLGFALGLMGGESAVGVLGYVLAYELVGSQERPRERLAALMPVGMLTLAYLVPYKLYGYGASGSGSYIDPVGDPGAYLVSALGRVPALMGGLVLELPTGLWALDERTRPTLVVLGVLSTGLIVWLVRATWSALTEEERRTCRWLMLGGAFALVPVVAAFPSQRLLLVPGIGGLVAVAAVLVHAWRSRERGWRPRGVAAGAAVLALAHIVMAPFYWVLMTLSFQEVGRQLDPTLAALERELDPALLPEQRVMTLAIPIPVMGMYLPGIMATRGMPQSRAWWPLTLSPRPQVFTRTGESSFELSMPEGRFLASEFEAVFRGRSHPLAQGEQVLLPGMTVTILETDEEGILRIGFALDVPLEDPSLVFLAWREGALHRFTPPAVGQRVPL